MFSTVPAIAQGAIQAVRVVNNSGQPVPTAAQGTTTVTGTVNVGNTPSVSVTNTPNVNIANTPNVTLSSGASVAVTSPLDGQGNPTPIATLEAVQVYGSSCVVRFNGSDYGTCSFTAVPQGQQLVIQEFDASGFVETGNRPLNVEIQNTITGGNYFPYTFLVTTGGADSLATHQETRVYVSQSVSPVCAISLPQYSNGGYVCDISGFLVDASMSQQGITVQHQKPRLALPNRAPAR